MSNVVLLTDRPFGTDELETRVLADAGLELLRAPDSELATLLRLASDVAGILVCYARIDAEVIEAAARGGCRVIARYGIGYDNIDIEAATALGVAVTYVPDYCIGEVADHTLALLLAAGRAIVSAAAGVRAGAWSVPNSGVRRLQGSRLALIGVGRIGHAVAERALALGMEVVAHDPYASTWDERIERTATIEEALTGSQFVSLHAPLTADNAHLIGAAELGRLAPGAVLVNTSRGGLVDLSAVVAALDSGQLAAVGLDTTEPEPLPAEHPLYTHPNAVVTPHMAFYSEQAQNELQQRAVTSVVDVLSGRVPRNPVNVEGLAGAS